MSTRLRYDTKSPHGQITAEAIDALIQAREKVDRVLKAAQSMTYGNDYAQLELELGLVAGTGQQFLYFAQALSDALHAQPLFDITGQLDQG